MLCDEKVTVKWICESDSSCKEDHDKHFIFFQNVARAGLPFVVIF